MVRIAAAALLLAPAGEAFAQPVARSGVEFAAGARWIGPLDFGKVVASEATSGGGTAPLFATDTTLEGSVGATAAFGIRLSPQFRAEVTLAYNPTHLATRITSDAEGIADVTVEAPVTQFLVEGGVVAQPARWQRGRMAPFITGGAGYLRQLHDGRTLVETGRSYYAGGGLYYVRATAGRRRLKASGLRMDVRALILQKGVAPDDSSRVTPAVSAAWFARF